MYFAWLLPDGSSSRFTETRSGRRRRSRSVDYIGISGWTYRGWRGVFYPEDLVQKRELAYASRAFNSIEINGTHYGLQRPKAFQKWDEETPDGFVFAVKGSRYITHLTRLKDPEEALANFFASGLLVLGKKLGPILWQLPPSFRYDRERLDEFFKLLPRTTTAAAKLARKHTLAQDRVWLKPGGRRPIRHCLEVRHESFLIPEFYELLRKHDVAFVFADTAGKWPYTEDITSDFVYIRLHGDSELYVSGYTEKAQREWARKIKQWRSGRQPGDATLIARRAAVVGERDVYVYFDNDAKVKAPHDAKRLAELLNQRR